MGAWGTANEHVDEAESATSVDGFIKIDEASAVESGDVEDRVGLELELFFRAICWALLGHIEPVRR